MNGPIFYNENSHADSDSAHEDDRSRRPPRPKWGGDYISLVLNCVSRQFSRIPFGNQVKTHNPSANQRRAISSVGMESSFLAIRQDGEQIVHMQGTGVVLVYVWRWSSHIEISGKRPIRSGLGIVV